VLLNQAKKGKICVYCVMGKKQADVKRIEGIIKSHGVRKQCVLVAAEAGSATGEIVLAPFTAMTIAEHFRDLGKDSLVILDDLTVQAMYFREVSLLSGKFPGRESYPGEVFYHHARLLERAGNFKIRNKKVSITALPVAETLSGDMTGYIQTNLMSMTDGHLFFDEDLFLQGRRPAINVFLSVTRVGKQTQSRLMQELNSEVLKILKKRHDAERYLRFGTEMTEKVVKLVRRGDKLWQFFNQSGGCIESNLYPISLSLVLVGLILMDKFDGTGGEEWIKKYEKDNEFQNMIDSVVTKAKDVRTFYKLLKGYEKLK